MAAAFVLPPEVLARFRAVGFERLERIDAAWRELTQGELAPKVEDTLYRELHTLKGDARVVGYAEVGLLCQRLEDLLAAARDRRYRVHEDVDIVVTMAVQFIGMLIRRKPGGAPSGIDLDGFLEQLESVLSEWLRRSSGLPAEAPHELAALRLPAIVHALPGARQQLSALATTLYLEHLHAAGSYRSRLRDVWRGLLRVVTDLGAVPVEPFVQRHVASAVELAKELGKEITIKTDLDGVRIQEELVDTLNVAVLHLLRNAVDHGVEAPASRGGKPRVASIRVTTRLRNGDVELIVEDDGAGIDRASVRARAIEKKLLAEEATPTDAELVELVFHPHFSTRKEVTDVSGRGVGLDAVRAALARISGTITVESPPGKGTRFRAHLPRALDLVEVHAFRAARAPVLVCVDASWTVTVVDQADQEAPCATALLGLPDLPDELAPRGALSLALERKGSRLVVRAGGEPRRRVALRVCPMPATERVEIADVDGEDALFVRPDLLGGAR